MPTIYRYKFCPCCHRVYSLKLTTGRETYMKAPFTTRADIKKERCKECNAYKGVGMEENPEVFGTRFKKEVIKI
jgi:hypothetical protein